MTDPEEPDSTRREEPTSGFRLDGVSLIGDPSVGSDVIDGLTLLFDAAGFVIVGPEPGASRRVQWSAVTRAAVGLVVAGTDGGIATPLDVTASGRTVRFMLPASRVSQPQVSLLERRLLEWNGAPGPEPRVHTAPPSPWPPSDGWPQPAGAPRAGAWSGGAPRAGAWSAGAGAWSAGSAPLGGWPRSTTGPQWAGGQPPTIASSTGSVQSGWAVHPTDHLAEHSRRRRRKVVGMGLSGLLVLAGVGIWLGLALTQQSTSSTTSTTQPSRDQQLAQKAMLSKSDLPAGWQPSPGNSSGTSPADRKAEQQITNAFQTCMGVTADQATTVLGGQSKDQTAQAQSPVFVGPGAGSAAGAATELQSWTAVVKSHADEQSDYAIFTNPRFPQCNATEGAAEAQLGLNDSSGAHDQPGPAEGHTVSLAPVPGEQLLEVESTFTLNAGGHPVVVQNYQVLVAGNRVEASLGAFALGTGFPSGVLSSSVSTLEHRVAIEGSGKGSA
ncbi:MAG TPA: hypothetical protein VHZ02_03945 [Acidimicrobiales bacterium]|nr:hypothetical protein [Acidimicrobiales bacterium]